VSHKAGSFAKDRALVAKDSSVAKGAEICCKRALSQQMLGSFMNDRVPLQKMVCSFAKGRLFCKYS